MPGKALVGRGADPVATRARILRAATAIYNARGVDALTVRAVARKARVTAPTIYWHFESMAALHGTIVEGAFQTLGEVLQGITGPSPMARLSSACRIYRDFALDNPQAYRTMFVAFDPEGGLLRTARPTPGRQTFQVLQDAVAVCVENGELTGRPHTIALAIWGTCHGLVMLQLSAKMGLERGAFGRFYDSTVSTLLEGFRANRTR